MTGVPQKPNPTPPPSRSWYSPSGLWQRKTTVIAALSIACILMHLVLRLGLRTAPGIYHLPLLATLVVGGLPLLYDLLKKLLKREFGSDLLGGISIITSVLLGEYLAGRPSTVPAGADRVSRHTMFAPETTWLTQL